MTSSLMYNNRIFASVSNSSSGEVDAQTRFHYHQQQEDIVWAEYSGGSVVQGHLIATVSPVDHSLDMRYHHVNRRGELMTGICRSVPQVLDDGRLRMIETWTWTCGDGSSGASVIEEVKE